MFPRSDTLRFETIAGLGPGGGGAIEPAEPAPEPEPEAADQFTVTPEMWEQQQALLAQQQQQLEQYQQVFNPQPLMPGQEPRQFNPFDDDPTAQLREIIREEMAPYQNYAEQFEMQQTEEQARDVISAIASERGHELQDGVGDLIIAQAAAYAPAVAQQYGQGPQAMEAAISAAYDDVLGAMQAYAEARATQQQNHLTTLSSAPTEPSSAGGGAVQQVTTAPGGFDAVINKWSQLSG